MFSSWTPSKEELELLNGGAPVWLIQKGNYIPEMTMMAGTRDMVVPPITALETLNDQENEKIAVLARKENEFVEFWSTLMARMFIVFALGSVITLLYLGYKLW